MIWLMVWKRKNKFEIGIFRRYFKKFWLIMDYFDHLNLKIMKRFFLVMTILKKSWKGSWRIRMKELWFFFSCLKSELNNFFPQNNEFLILRQIKNYQRFLIQIFFFSLRELSISNQGWEKPKIFLASQLFRGLIQEYRFWAAFSEFLEKIMEIFIPFFSDLGCPEKTLFFLYFFQLVSNEFSSDCFDFWTLSSLRNLWKFYEEKFFSQR